MEPVSQRWWLWLWVLTHLLQSIQKTHTMTPEHLNMKSQRALNKYKPLPSGDARLTVWISSRVVTLGLHEGAIDWSGFWSEVSDIPGFLFCCWEWTLSWFWRFSTPHASIPAGSRELQQEAEEVDDVQVEAECGENIFLWTDGVALVS